MESLGRMVLDIENMKREFRKFYQLAESLTGMQNDLNQFRKVASDVRQMKTAMSQLQVSAKLNGNAVARILQQMQEQEPEPDSTEDSAESCGNTAQSLCGIALKIVTSALNKMVRRTGVCSRCTPLFAL